MRAAVTATGGFGIGFRLGWSPWQKNFPEVIAFAKANGFACLDLGKDGDQRGREVVQAGLRIGSVDLIEWQGMISADRVKREDAIARNRAYVSACAEFGAFNQFCVMLPDDPARKHLENFGFMVDAFTRLAPVFEQSGAKLVIEGWPGPGALCCNPEGYREFFKECPSAAYGINYDPSHLVRMGIDPVRFLHEFAGRVFHVHGKDTEIFPEAIYEFGWNLPAIKAQTAAFGSTFWRYTIPGHGEVRWKEILRILAERGYQGFISIELEDQNFNGSEAGERQGLQLARDFLRGV